nr:cadherin-like beta sandwich domain-containing protein [Bacillota bacterium]
SKDTVTYAVYGSGSPASLTVTATAYSSSSSLTIGGQPAGSGSPCEVSLDNGANLIPIVVTASDGQTQRAYILSVNGTVDDTGLGDLSTDIGTLDFDPSVVTYNLGSVANSESGIDITAAPHDPKALVLLNGIPIQEGESRTINLNYGVNDIDIMVVAQNAATKTYTISITRGMPSISWDAGSLQAADIGAAWLTLTWPAAFCDAGISGYNIYEGGSLLSKVADSVRSFNAAGLTQGTAYNFSVRAVDTAGSLSSPLTLSVSTSPGLEITTAALAGATVAQTYNAALEGCGGNAPYTWSAAGLPAGLTLGSADGTITGAAAAAGTSMVNVTLTDSNGLSTSRGFVLNVFYPAGTGKYTITPVNGPEITVGATEQGITTLTVNNGVTGFKYFEVNVATTESHDGNETVVFVQMRGGVQIAMNATRADFDRISNAIAAFNVRPEDVIKVYVVDDLTNDAGSNPSLLQ